MAEEDEARVRVAGGLEREGAEAGQVRGRRAASLGDQKEWVREVERADLLVRPVRGQWVGG